MIGVLCSGGDSAGMNAGVAAVVTRARQVGCEVVGIQGGFVGLAEKRVMALEERTWESLSRRGGCMLGSSRVPAEMSREQLLERALEGCRLLGLKGLVVLGGNGSLSGLAILSHHLPGAGIPATIDNDLAGSTLSIGFDTARQHGIVALDCIRDTAEALPGRVFVLQTLGGGTGHLALATAYAGLAHLVLAPEIGESGAAILDRARHCLGRQEYLLVVVSEGSDWAGRVASLLEEGLQLRVRSTVLGHAQRGGVPTGDDRRLARVLGSAAVDVVVAGESAAVGWNGTAVIREDLAAASAARPLDRELYQAVWERTGWV